jgi:hypothetical protein
MQSSTWGMFGFHRGGKRIVEADLLNSSEGATDACSARSTRRPYQHLVKKGKERPDMAFDCAGSEDDCLLGKRVAANG